MRLFNRRLNPLALFLFAGLFILANSTQAQERQRPDARGKQPDFSSMTKEQRLEALNQRLEQQVNRYLEEMGEHAPTEQQLKPFKELVGANLLNGMKLRLQMRQAREKQKGNPRETMMEFRAKREKLDAELLKGMKELLEKPQFKAFKKAKDKIQPQQRPGRGPGGGGGGGRGPGGGGGGF